MTKDLHFSHPVSAMHECPAGRPEFLSKTGVGMALVQTTEIWGYPDSVDSDQSLAGVSVRAAMYCCS